MTTEVFVPYKPHAATLRVVEQANAIIGEYEFRSASLTYLPRGGRLSLRQTDDKNAILPIDAFDAAIQSNLRETTTRVLALNEQ
jgi:hypothetical protein